MLNDKCFLAFKAAYNKPNFKRRNGITMKQLKRMPPVFRALRFHYTPEEIDVMGDICSG